MTIWLYALSSISAVLIAIFFVLARKPVGLPPGPPGLPIFGNIFDFNPKTAYKTFGDWGKQYGKYYYYYPLRPTFGKFWIRSRYHDQDILASMDNHQFRIYCPGAPHKEFKYNLQ